MLITENSAKRWQIWSDEPSFTFPTSGFMFGRHPRKPLILNASFKLWNIEPDLWWIGQQYLIFCCSCTYSEWSNTADEYMVELQLLITENSTKRWKIWSDEPSFTFPTSGWVYVWTSPKEASNPECLVQIVKRRARSVMNWAAISSILLLLYLLWMIKLLPVTTWTF